MINSDQKVAKVAKEYYCDSCYYKCYNKTNYDKHLATAKHKKLQIMINSDQKVANNEFICLCGKSYKHNRSLWYHKQKCSYIENIENVVNENQDKEIILSLVNESRELRNMMIEQQKQISELIPKVGTTINNTINNNQKFNINVFLNEKCRDAINMTDFIKSIKISIEQLEAIKTTGMAQGLSSAIMTNLNSLSVYERPIHCTDIKRETLYIKDDNQWECDSDKTRIKTAIKQMAGKPYVPLQEWISQNPDFKEVDEKQDYVANVLSTIGKSTDTIDKKIIKNVCISTYVKNE
tara:strand:- start:6133 stop:7011 length:879 start_codon:yes stop_codon:yes gene_type:complete